MKIQKSFNYKKDTGILYLVGTPIGNLSDITYRALQTLEEVDLIAAEDTRHTIKLLNHFNINKKLISYHEHNKENSGENLLNILTEGKDVALVSDAGMPAISDPGYEIVRDALEKGITVIPIPGVNAALTGLIASGISTRRFVFLGFLNNEKKNLIKELIGVKQYTETLICYEAPHRILKTLEVIKEILGNRLISLSRELTKKHEEFIRGTVEEVVEYLKETQLKGEITIIIEGAQEIDLVKEDSWWSSFTIIDHVNHNIAKGQEVREAIKQTALERGISKRDVYQEYHVNS
ncbi:MAG: 16S rRNA (cytidine(1402)-2'-O)-methyltransferase [Vulcanibacillus sp.]